MAEVYDVAILGSTPAAFAAAHRLAKASRSVILLGLPADDTECPLCDWAPAGALATASLPKSLARSCGARTFKHVIYHDVSLAKTVQYRSSVPAGLFVEYSRLQSSLKTAAQKAGAKVKTASAAPAIRLMEEQVVLESTPRIAARLLIVAHGRPAEAIHTLGMPQRASQTTQLSAAGLDVPISEADAKELGDALNVAEMPERTELGMFFALGRKVHIRVVSSSSAAGARAEELSALVGKLQQASLLPGGMQLGKARGAVWHAPAGVALELERHAVKRCLIVGTAGGFAEPVTGQTVRPSIESAIIAAETAIEALDSPDTQQILMTFSSAWRKRLGTCMGPPSTSLQLLLPLLFVNKTIVTRFTRALLHGENI
jgi:flavin-dependent dehydrogenase